MSEEKKVIYCTQCGSENDDNSKFCQSCGSAIQKAEAEPNTQQDEGVFSSEQTAPVYEKVTEAEEVKPEPQINYNKEPYEDPYKTPYSETSYETSQPVVTTTAAEKKTGGNIGLAIASLICGILSMLCCCLVWFSAVLGIAAVVLGIITITQKYDGKGMAIAGIVTGALGIVLVLGLVVLTAAEGLGGMDILDEITDSYY